MPETEKPAEKDIMVRLTEAIESIDKSLKFIATMLEQETKEQEPEEKEPVPTGILYKPASGNFVAADTGVIMGKKFRDQWMSRKNEFPKK